MNIDFNETIARCVLIFLLGISIYVILGRVELFDGSVWKDVLAGALSVGLSEVFLNYSKTRKKKR